MTEQDEAPSVYVRSVIYRVIEYLAKTGDWVDEDIAALRAALASLSDLAAANERIARLEAALVEALAALSAIAPTPNTAGPQDT